MEPIGLIVLLQW